MLPLHGESRGFETLLAYQLCYCGGTADTPDLESGAFGRAGSTPVSSTIVADISLYSRGWEVVLPEQMQALLSVLFDYTTADLENLRKL